MSQISESLLPLTPKERIYVQNRLGGLTKVASCRAAGYADPQKVSGEIEKRPQVQAAIVAACEDMAEEIGFGRKEAHDMLMDAYRNAATASEQIQAVRELINLHGLAAPKQVEHTVEHKGALQLERLDTRELMKLAGMESLAIDGEFEVLDDKPMLKDMSGE